MEISLGSIEDMLLCMMDSLIVWHQQQMIIILALRDIQAHTDALSSAVSVCVMPCLNQLIRRWPLREHEALAMFKSRRPSLREL